VAIPDDIVDVVGGGDVGVVGGDVGVVGGDVVVGGDGRMLMINCCTKCPGTI
jgi:hypothetical protein